MYQDKNKYFIIVEIMSYPLNELIDSFQGLITENACRYIIAKTLKGLYALHRLNIIHRDIKSDNVLINNEGAIKIADFGLSAQLTREEIKLSEETGTPHWTAPEII